MATGSTSATEYESDMFKFFGKGEDGVYTCAWLDCVDSHLPTPSSLGTGIVVEDTILLCDGYTSSGSRECYELKPGQNMQARPPLDIPIGGHSVFVPRQGSPNEWWLAANAQGGTKRIQVAYFLPGSSDLVVGGPGPWNVVQYLPEPLSVVCLMKIAASELFSADLIFLSGVPTTSASSGNKNWMKQIGGTPEDDSAWVELPQSLEKRLGGSCGVLHQFSTTTGTDNATVIVMAGGLRSSTSEFLRIPVVSSTMTSVRSFEDILWQIGPDVGESRCVT